MALGKLIFATQDVMIKGISGLFPVHQVMVVRCVVALLILLAVAVIPSFLGETRFASLEYSLLYRWTPERRMLDYLRFVGVESLGDWHRREQSQRNQAWARELDRLVTRSKQVIVVELPELSVR